MASHSPHLIPGGPAACLTLPLSIERVENACGQANEPSCDCGELKGFGLPACQKIWAWNVRFWEERTGLFSLNVKWLKTDTNNQSLENKSTAIVIINFSHCFKSICLFQVLERKVRCLFSCFLSFLTKCFWGFELLVIKVSCWALTRLWWTFLVTFGFKDKTSICLILILSNRLIVT